MSEMIERVAEAMKNRRRELIHAPLDRIWDDLARAAIEAMREPTDAMLRQGIGIALFYDSGMDDAEVKELWGAMAGEALK